MQLNEFLRLLKDIKGNGNQYQAKCPAHEDKNPSLSIAGDNGKILCYGNPQLLQYGNSRKRRLPTTCVWN